MKNRIKIMLVSAAIAAAASGARAQGDKIDQQRMDRDIEVAENVLSTLVRQQLGKRNFFPLEVEGAYLPGFGVTLRLPGDNSAQMMWMSSDGPNVSYSWDSGGGPAIVTTGTGRSYSNSTTNDDDADEGAPVKTMARGKVTRVAPAARGGFNGRTAYKKLATDSLRNAYNLVVITAAKDFIADYGDMISQLGPDERIVVTNRTDNRHDNWLVAKMDGDSRSLLSIEATKADLSQFKQNKISREQFFAKMKVVNSQTSEELSPDLELLSSIFNRLYNADLSKTYYLQEPVSYERLKDYGVIYDMHAYSSYVVAEDYNSNGTLRRLYDMPTLQLNAISKDERTKKVKELYPAFEKGILEDILEYGKTLKSLSDNELVIFNIRLTECKGCGIPMTLEVSFKENVLKDYSSGKLTREAALAKGVVKKGPNQ